jgi:transcriptional regulator with XRE-family HTH domain
MADLNPDLPLVLRLRLERGITIAEVERQTGVNHKTIVSWENGTQLRPNAVTLKALADFYGVSPSELYADFRRRELEQELETNAA